MRFFFAAMFAYRPFMSHPFRFRWSASALFYVIRCRICFRLPAQTCSSFVTAAVYGDFHATWLDPDACTHVHFTFAAPNGNGDAPRKMRHQYYLRHTESLPAHAWVEASVCRQKVEADALGVSVTVRELTDTDGHTV